MIRTHWSLTSQATIVTVDFRGMEQQWFYASAAIIETTKALETISKCLRALKRRFKKHVQPTRKQQYQAMRRVAHSLYN